MIVVYLALYYGLLGLSLYILYHARKAAQEDRKRYGSEYDLFEFGDGLIIGLAWGVLGYSLFLCLLATYAFLMGPPL